MNQKLIKSSFELFSIGYVTESIALCQKMSVFELNQSFFLLLKTAEECQLKNPSLK